MLLFFKKKQDFQQLTNLNLPSNILASAYTLTFGKNINAYFDFFRIYKANVLNMFKVNEIYSSRKDYATENPTELHQQFNFDNDSSNEKNEFYFFS